jgi:hypothetical protein
MIDFEKGKVKGLLVVVEGEPTSDTDILFGFHRNAIQPLANIYSEYIKSVT